MVRARSAVPIEKIEAQPALWANSNQRRTAKMVSRRAQD
jgi:hypothetical protein